GYGAHGAEISTRNELRARVANFCQRILDAVVSNKDAESIPRREIIRRSVKKVAVEKEDQTWVSFDGHNVLSLRDVSEDFLVDLVFQICGQRGQPCRLVAIALLLGHHIDHALAMRAWRDQHW